MRYLVNILCCSLLLFGELESTDDDRWIEMMDWPEQAVGNMFHTQINHLEKSFVRDIHNIKPLSELSQDNYLKLCYRLAVGNVYQLVYHQDYLKKRAKIARHFCRIPDPLYMIPSANQIKLKFSPYKEHHIPPLHLLSCDCKFEGSYIQDVKFYIGVAMLERTSSPRFYYQFDTYSQFHEEVETALQLSACWVLQGDELVL